jgi:hypothetical protein
MVYVRRTHLVERVRFDALLGCYFCSRIITYQETANLSILKFPFNEVIQDGFHAVSRTQQCLEPLMNVRDTGKKLEL